MPVRNRRDDAGDVAQRHGGRGGSPGLVESLGQAGAEHDERVRASHKRGEDPGAGHGLVVKKNGGETRVDAHCSPSSAPSA